MAVNLFSQTFELSGDKLLISNSDPVGRERRPPTAKPPTPHAVVAQVEQKLVPKELGPVAVLDAGATITASMPAAATIAGAAEVRANPGTDPSLILDFQGLRTVSEITAPTGATIKSVRAWLGTAFAKDDAQGLKPDGGGNTVTFTELQTERLLVTFTSAVTVDAFANSGSVVLPTPPADLEVLVNGTRAFFRKGPYDGSALPDPIDLKDAVTAAAANGGDVTVTFRAAAPASLTLAASATLLQRYTVLFAEPPTVDAPTEGVYSLELPIRASDFKAPTVYARCILLDVSAKLPPTRVTPADGPALTDGAELVVDPDHGILAQLPTSATGPLGTLTGVRLPVVVGAAGAELAGTLRSAVPQPDHESTRPGDAIPKGALGPVTLQATPASTPYEWIDLALTAPHALKQGDIVWLEVQAARGSVDWKLAVPPANATDSAPLLRRTSNGKYVGLSTLEDIPYTGALRVVGQEAPTDPLAAMLVSVHGAPEAGSVAGVPAPGGTTLKLVLAPPGVPVQTSQQTLRLDLTISAPGTYAISGAELQYTTQ